MKGIEAVTPDSLLLLRAREALAGGALDAVALMERVCSLPGAPRLVAERLAEALFSRHADFVRDAEGRWFIANDRERATATTMGGGIPRAVFGGEPRHAARERTERERTVQERTERERTVPERTVRERTVRERTERERTVRERREAATSSTGDDVQLRDLRFAVVDVETTGMSPSQSDRVTEIAIVHVERGEVAECYETLVNPGRPIPPAIIALTQITQEMVRTAPPFPQVAADVVGRLRERVFVAHNAPFDWRFVSHEVQRSAGVVLRGEALCTVRLSRALLPQLPRRSLDAVTHYFGIDIGARHRAAGDALATAHVLLRLLQLAEERGASTWRELIALLQGGRARAARRRSALPRGVDVDPTL